MRRQLIASNRAGESITRQAERLLDIDNPVVRLPQHVRELRDAARLAIETGDENHYHAAVDRWRGRIEKLGQGRHAAPGAHTMRSATQQLVTELGRARADQVDTVVDRWVVEKARYQARRVARTETVEGFRDVYKQSVAEQPYTHGMRWVLSKDHPQPDVCDIYAGQDLYKLGPGVYTAGELPVTPHPHCLCAQVAVIDEDHFKRELAKLTGDKEPARPWEKGTHRTGQEWLATQSEAYQRRLLGPTRFEALKQGKTVIDARGNPLPVHVVTGTAPPVRRAGPPANVRRALAGDRANQVQPFPHVPPAL